MYGPFQYRLSVRIDIEIFILCFGIEKLGVKINFKCVSATNIKIVSDVPFMTVVVAVQ